MGTRIRRGHGAGQSVIISGAQPVLALFYGIRRRKPVSGRVHRFLPPGDYIEEDWNSSRTGLQIIEGLQSPASMLLYKGMELSAEKKCLHVALRLLAIRDHSCTELARKLNQRGFARHLVKHSVDECLRLNYLDDKRFSHSFLRQLRRKGYGPYQIQQRLRSKGICDAMIQEVLDRTYPESAQIEDCRRVMQKKLASPSFASRSGPLNDRLFRFLLGRGFHPEVIRQSLDASPQGPTSQAYR